MGPKGPPAGAEGWNPPQELEKARKAGYFSSLLEFVKINESLSIFGMKSYPSISELWEVKTTHI